MVDIYVPLFWTESPESLLKFAMLLQKIIWGQYLSMVHPKFGVTRNLVVGEALRVFEKKT